MGATPHARLSSEEEAPPGSPYPTPSARVAGGSEMTAIPLSRTIEYPESDGRPMAETQAHGQGMVDLFHALSRRYAEVPDVYVWFNMLLYFVQGDPRACVAPDVFLVRGVDKH